MLMRTPDRWVRPKRRAAPDFILPCQPTPSVQVPSGPEWIHEVKHDGFRIVAFKDGERVKLWSRNGRDWSAEFVAITDAVRALPFDRIMLDGEAVAHCLEGLPDFHGLLGDGQASACLYAFDLLALDDADLRGLPLLERRKRLFRALRRVPQAIRLSEHLEGSEGPAAFLAACRMGLEGIVSKRVDRAYRSGRCAHWLKIRNPAYERRSELAWS